MQLYNLEHFREFIELDFAKTLKGLAESMQDPDSNTSLLIDIIAKLKSNIYYKIDYFGKQIKKTAPEDPYLLSLAETLYGLPNDIFSIATTIQERVRNLELQQRLSVGIWSEAELRLLFLDFFNISQMEFTTGTNNDDSSMFPLAFPILFVAAGEDSGDYWYVHLPASEASGPYVEIIEKLLTKIKPAYSRVYIIYDLV